MHLTALKTLVDNVNSKLNERYNWKWCMLREIRFKKPFLIYLLYRVHLINRNIMYPIQY